MFRSGSKGSRYTCIDKDTSRLNIQPHLFTVLTNTNEIQLFDERFMSPLVSWKGPYEMCNMLSTATGFNCSGGGGLILTSGPYLSEATVYPFSVTDPSGRGAASEKGQNLVEKLLDIPEGLAKGSGLSLQHSKSYSCTPLETVDWMRSVQGAVHVQKTHNSNKNSDGNGDKPLFPVMIPDPKQCTGIRVFRDRGNDGVFLCSLASDFGLTISHAAALGEEEEEKGKEPAAETLEYGRCALVYDTLRGPTTDSDHPTDLAVDQTADFKRTVKEARAFVEDISSYQDLRSLVRKVNLNSQRLLQGNHSSTVYELLHEQEQERGSGHLSGGGSYLDHINKAHYSQLRQRNQQSDEVGLNLNRSLSLLSTVLELDPVAFFGKWQGQEQEGQEDLHKTFERHWKEQERQQSGGG
jgi:hypothetical protein